MTKHNVAMKPTVDELRTELLSVTEWAPPLTLRYHCEGLTVPDEWSHATPVIVEMLQAAFVRFNGLPINGHLRDVLRAVVNDSMRRRMWGTDRHISKPLRFSLKLADGSVIDFSPYD